MNIKELKNLRTRILKDNKTMSCFQGVVLELEFENLSLNDLTSLKDFIENHKNPATHDGLNAAIDKRS